MVGSLCSLTTWHMSWYMLAWNNEVNVPNQTHNPVVSAWNVPAYNTILFCQFPICFPWKSKKSAYFVEKNLDRIVWFFFQNNRINCGNECLFAGRCVNEPLKRTRDERRKTTADMLMFYGTVAITAIFVESAWSRLTHTHIWGARSLARIVTNTSQYIKRQPNEPNRHTLHTCTHAYTHTSGPECKWAKKATYSSELFR